MKFLKSWTQNNCNSDKEDVELRYNFKYDTDLDDISNLILTAKKTLSIKFKCLIKPINSKDNNTFFSDS